MVPAEFPLITSQRLPDTIKNHGASNKNDDGDDVNCEDNSAHLINLILGSGGCSAMLILTPPNAASCNCHDHCHNNHCHDT